ncbi:hypothetical protein CHC121_13920 [Helicobacter pylori]
MRKKKAILFTLLSCAGDDKVGKGKKNKNDDDTDDINFSELKPKRAIMPSILWTMRVFLVKKSIRSILQERSL